MAADERTPLIPGHAGEHSNGHANGNRHRPGNGHGSYAEHTKLATAGTAMSGMAKSLFGPANSILLAGFLMAFTLGITQVPILFVFRLMECDIFYTHNPPFTGGPPSQRCQRHEIDAGTALQYSVLGMSTSLSGVINLFVCGYFIKLWGPRWSFVSQTSLLGLRVSTQIIGVAVGGRKGELIFQVCQAIGMVGGPRGYQLVLNTAVGEVVAPKERTAVFGRLQGSIMLGTAFGYLLGGVLGDVYNISRPFEVAFFLYVISTLYGAFFLPGKAATQTTGSKKAVAAGRGLNGFFAPLRVIVPHKYRLESGQVVKNYGLVFLAIGISLGVFASGYAPLLLQMYATSAFHFSTTENGWLMFGISSIRGLFLLFMFPKIIRAGRIWYNGGVTPPHSVSQHHQNADSQSRPASGDADNEDDDERYTIERVPTNPEDFPAAEGNEVPQEPIQPVPTRETRPGPNADTGPNAGAEEEEDSGTGFDLLFVRWSLVVDSLVTLFAGFSTAGWQVYLAGFLLPFASGSAPAAKGVMTELCPPAQRPDAISAITLVESSAMLATQGLFGLIFAAFSDMGRPSLTFFCNAGIAVLGFTVLFMARLPPPHSIRIDDDDDDNHQDEQSAPLLHNGTGRQSCLAGRV